MKSIFLVFALGLAGIDPLGLAILLGAISAGGGKAQVIAFSLATFVGTVVLGALASIFGSQLADMIRPFIPGVNDPAWAVVELLVATLIGYWLFSRIKGQAETDEDAKSPTQSSLLGITLAGFAFSLSALPDPTFIATAAIASQASNIFQIAALHALWTLISQSFLFGFAVAFLCNLHQPLSDLVQPIWQRLRTSALVVLYVGLGALIVFLIVDAVSMLVTGEYFLQL